MVAYGAKELAAAFRTVRKNTIQIAEDIPEENYSFVPAPGVQSVENLLRHIAAAPRMWQDIHGTKRLFNFEGYDFLGTRDRVHADVAHAKTKAEIVALLRTSGEDIASWLGSLSDEQLAEIVEQPFGQGPRARFDALLGIKEHEMHHRGQLMLIERMLGVVPHLTRRMEEQIAIVRASQATA